MLVTYINSISTQSQCVFRLFPFIGLLDMVYAIVVKYRSEIPHCRLQRVSNHVTEQSVPRVTLYK